jgi:hypothetical protein
MHICLIMLHNISPNICNQYRQIILRVINKLTRQTVNTLSIIKIYLKDTKVCPPIFIILTLIQFMIHTTWDQIKKILRKMFYRNRKVKIQTISMSTQIKCPITGLILLTICNLLFILSMAKSLNTLRLQISILLI